MVIPLFLYIPYLIHQDISLVLHSEHTQDLVMSHTSMAPVDLVTTIYHLD